ncbi:MAG: plasmid stabilization protein [Arcobacter sp.]|nr:MAG: plasmid stabilization protein [Arcobacter sp.]
MIFKIVIEDEAFSDLQNIYNYIVEQDTKNKAKNFLSELQTAISTLNTMPNRCRNSYYNDDLNVKDLIYKSYTIVFKVIDESVHVLSVFRQREY